MRYFFNVDDGSCDDVGIELPGLDEVRKEALLGAADFLAEGSSWKWNGKHFDLNVTDETGARVLELRFQVIEPLKTSDD